MPLTEILVRQITCDEALRVARSDAERVYRDLELYRIELRLEPNGWHIDYKLRDGSAQGGGPHYVIDAGDGRILSKCYEQ